MKPSSTTTTTRASHTQVGHHNLPWSTVNCHDLQCPVINCHDLLWSAINFHIMCFRWLYLQNLKLFALLISSNPPCSAIICYTPLGGDYEQPEERVVPSLATPVHPGVHGTHTRTPVLPPILRPVPISTPLNVSRDHRHPYTRVGARGVEEYVLAWLPPPCMCRCTDVSINGLYTENRPRSVDIVGDFPCLVH